MLTADIPTRPKRHFIDENLEVKSWSQIENYFQSLLDANIQSVSDLEQWMLNRSELESVLEEEQAWRYIKMNIDTNLDVKNNYDPLEFCKKEILTRSYDNKKFSIPYNECLIDNCSENIKKQIQ